MATETPNLKLVKPIRGEFQDSWDLPVNKNWDIIDQAYGSLSTETTTARGSTASLDDRLNVSLNSDGSLKDPPEVAAARVSTIFGNVDPATSALLTLDGRIEQADREIWAARMGLSTLSASIAGHTDNGIGNTVISAPSGFLTFTGAIVSCDGSITNVVADINGYRQVVRKIISAPAITGAAGEYPIYLQRNVGGELYLNRSGVGQNSGQISTHTSGYLQKFTDSTQNFVTAGTQPGDIVEVTSTGSVNKDKYLVASVLGPNDLIIVGTFVSAQTNLNYTLSNPYAPTLGFDTSPHSPVFVSVPNKIYVGRATFDGTNVTTLSTYAVKGVFEQSFSITLTGGDFSQTILHNIGYMPRKVEFHGSQSANYVSSPLNPLSVAEATGSQRSVIADMSALQIRVKNALNGIFYKDFDGTSQTAGFLFVRAER